MRAFPSATWDPDVDAAWFRLAGGRASVAREVRPGVLLHVDRAGRTVGLEVLDFSRRIENFPRDVEVGIRRRVRVAKLGWYDKDVDAANFSLLRSKVIESEELSEGVILDLDRKDRVVGVEILNLSKRFAFDSPARLLLKRAKSLSQRRRRRLQVGSAPVKPHI